MTLDQESFERLLDLFDPDRGRAGQRYEATRRALVKFFECKGGRFPEDLADETLDRVARRVAEGEVIRAADPAAYVHGVARNVLRADWAQRDRSSAPKAAEPAGTITTGAPRSAGSLAWTAASRRWRPRRAASCSATTPTTGAPRSTRVGSWRSSWASDSTPCASECTVFAPGWSPASAAAWRAKQKNRRGTHE
jgi:hypothetical protein